MSQRKSGSTLTFESVAEQYPPSKYILVKPSIQRHLMTTVPMWSLDVATVSVDVNNVREAYPIAGGQMGLGKVILDQIADAADVTIQAHRADDRSNRMYAEFDAYAVMNTPSGGIRGRKATCDWDGVTAQDKVQNEARRYVHKAVDQKWNGFKNLTDSDIERAIENRFGDQWIREQEFGKRSVETKAANRAIRALLGIQTSYTKQDLQSKPFAVIRFVFTPDLSDPDIKMMVVHHGLNAQRMLSNDGMAAKPEPAQIPADTSQAAEIEADAHVVDDFDDDDDAPAVSNWQDAMIAWSDTILLGLTNVDDVTLMRKLKRRYNAAVKAQSGEKLQKIHTYMTENNFIDE